MAMLASMRGACKNSAGANAFITKGDTNRPNKKVMRHDASPALAGSKPPKMPLMPKMRPFNKMNMAEATPNSTPPLSEAQGVKCVQSMFMVFSLTVAISFVQNLHHRQGFGAADLVINVFAFTARADQPLFSQHAELLRQCGLADTQ